MFRACGVIYICVHILLKVLYDRVVDSSIFRGAVLRLLQLVRIIRTTLLVAIFAGSKNPLRSLLLSADCHDVLQRNRREGKRLTQVCALNVKHFHLCNKIAE